MNAEYEYLEAIGDADANRAAAAEQLRAGHRARAMHHGLNLARNLLKRAIYGSKLTIDYAVNGNRLPMPLPDTVISPLFGIRAGMAASDIKAAHQELPPSFIEAVALKNGPQH